MSQPPRREPTAEKGRTRRPSYGSVGVCGSCGNWVRPAYIDAKGRHTAIVAYGRNRVPCMGPVIPLEGALDR